MAVGQVVEYRPAVGALADAVVRAAAVAKVPGDEAAKVGGRVAKQVAPSRARHADCFEPEARDVVGRLVRSAVGTILVRDLGRVEARERFGG